MKPCGHQQPRLPDPPWSTDYCHVCLLYETDPAYRALWDGQAVGAATTASRSIACVYLGRVLDRQGCICPRKWLHQCAVHQTCTLEICQTCPDYEEDN